MLHPRRLLPLGAGVLVLAAAPVAGAAVRSSVTVHNQGAAASTWSLKVKLVRGARLVGANGFAASRRTGTVTLTPRAKRALAAGAARTLTVTTSGRRAPRFSVAGRACTARRHVVRCTVGRRPAVVVPGRPAAPAPGAPSGPATPTPAPGAPSGPSGPAAPSGERRWPAFAPYVDVSSWPAPDWTAMSEDADVAALSLGFVNAEDGADCTPTWGGYTEYPASGASPYAQAGIAKFEPVLAFGGATGTELAAACGSAAATAAAYEQAIDAYDATHIDLDIEGATLANTAANTRRAGALRLLQDRFAAAGRPLRIGFTVAVDTNGLPTAVRTMLDEVADAGVDIALVNIMAMNFGSTSDSLTLFTGAATTTRDQLATLWPGLTPGERMSRLGVTPMVGRNDNTDEVTTVAEAQSLAGWAGAHHPAMLGLWSLGRDHQCPAHPRPSSSPPLDDCSDVAQSDWAFAHALGAFTE